MWSEILKNLLLADRYQKGEKEKENNEAFKVYFLCTVKSSK